MPVFFLGEIYDHIFKPKKTGKIVRMLLIQMQYVKKELLVAMEGP